MAGNSGDTQGNGGWRRGADDSGSSWAERERANERKNSSFGEKERAKEKGGFYRGGRSASNAASDAAAAAFRNAEDNSVGNEDAGDGANGDGLLGVESSEREAGGLFNGVGREKEGKKKGKGKGKGFLKRKGPMALILGLILGVGGIMGGSQLLMPFSLVAQFQETFNSMHTSTRLRSNSFLRYQMMTDGRVKEPTVGRIFGEDKFKITKSQAKKLAAQGIEYVDDYPVGTDGETTRVLRFDDGSGDMKIVAADADAAMRIGNGAVSFDEMYESNSDFYNGYNKGSMTWRGAISNWFDTITVKFLQSNKITRNLFKDFQEKVKANNDGNTRRTAALELMAKGADELVEGGYKMKGVEEGEEPELDANGKTVGYGEYRSGDVNDVDLDSENVGGKYKLNDAEPRTVNGKKTSRSTYATEPGVKAKLNDIASNVQKGANVVCTVFNVAGTIGLLVTASEALQIINLVTGYFEAIDKAKAGDGADSPIYELANALTEKKANTNVEIVSTGTWSENNQDSNFVDDGEGGKRLATIDTKETTTTKSAMESSGIVALYGGGAVNPKDPSVQSFNFTGSLKKILGGLGASVGMFETCAIAKIVANGITAVADAASVIACLGGLIGAAFSFGGTAVAGCAPLVADIGLKVTLSVAISLAVGGLISAITPAISSWITRDLISDIGGEALGNALTSGANMYMGNTHRANGGSLANRNTYIAYTVEHQKVIADDAKYERQTKSPFDASSKNTFFGVLANNMISLASANSAVGLIASVGKTMSSSIMAITPAAMADNIASTLPTEEEYEETCPYLASIGAVGDAYCNPYSITDMSTINMDPSTVVEAVKDNLLESDTANGNVKVKPDSDLAKYILFCDNRTSSFGIADQNIASAVSDWGQVSTSSSFVNNTSNAIIGTVPVVGDVIDVVDNIDSYRNIGYISGESCVAGNEVDSVFEQSPNWEKAKYYQRFIEDQSLAETIGLFGEDGKSAVSVFLDDYYKENPLDNSYEGILARYSGLTKDTVVAVLDFVDYYDYIAQYDASERYAFGAPVVEKDDTIMFDNENVMAGEYVLVYDIAYADVRNRVNLV